MSQVAPGYFFADGSLEYEELPKIDHIMYVDILDIGTVVEWLGKLSSCQGRDLERPSG